MMGSQNSASPSSPEISQQQQEETQGKSILEHLKNKSIACKDVSESDFEKIGEYAMSRMFNGSTAGHIEMNERIKNMQGENGEAQMHIRIGKNISGCGTSGIFWRGGGGHMMGWGGNNMMYEGSSFGVLAYIVHIIVIVDLVLVGIWLFQQITSHKRK